MQRHILILLFVLVIGLQTAFANSLFTYTCTAAQLVTIHGQVTDDYGAVSGTTLVLTRGQTGETCEVVTSTTFGYYSFSPVFTDTYTLTAYKKGYVNYLQFINAIDSDYTINIHLTPE